jgi:hypothetical protein
LTRLEATTVSAGFTVTAAGASKKSGKATVKVRSGCGSALGWVYSCIKRSDEEA